MHFPQSAAAHDAGVLQGQTYAAPLLDGIVAAWIEPLTSLLVGDAAHDETARADARLALAVARGLLPDLLATGDQAGVDAAFERYLTHARTVLPDKADRRRLTSAAAGAVERRARNPADVPAVRCATTPMTVGMTVPLPLARPGHQRSAFGAVPWRSMSTTVVISCSPTGRARKIRRMNTSPINV